MKSVILVSFLLMAGAAHATPVPVSVECRGSNVVLQTRSADARWAKAPYHYRVSDLITVKINGIQKTLIAQNVESAAGALHVLGEDLASGDRFSLMVNLSNGQGELGLPRAALKLACASK